MTLRDTDLLAINLEDLASSSGQFVGNSGIQLKVEIIKILQFWPKNHQTTRQSPKSEAASQLQPQPSDQSCAAGE